MAFLHLYNGHNIKRLRWPPCEGQQGSQSPHSRLCPALCWRGAHTGSCSTTDVPRMGQGWGARGTKGDFLKKVASELKLKMASSVSRHSGLGDSTIRGSGSRQRSSFLAQLWGQAMRATSLITWRVEYEARMVSGEAGEAGKGQILEGSVGPTKPLGLHCGGCEGVGARRDVFGSVF